MQKTIKRFQKITGFRVPYKENGVDFYRGKGLLAKKVPDTEPLRWQDNARDADKDAVKKATFTDEYERIETQSIWNLFFNRHAENWVVFGLPLETKLDIRNFDLQVLDIIRTRNKSTMSPNSFEIHKRRKHGQNHRTKILVRNGKQVVHEPLDFRFTIKLVPKLEAMSLTMTDLTGILAKEF